MKKKKLFIALLLLLSLSLAACSGDSGSFDRVSSEAAGSANFWNESNNYAPKPSPASPASPADFDGVAEPEFPSTAGTGGYPENTKIILTASLELQTTSFDEAVAALDKLVADQKGYYESSNYSYGGYYSSGTRWGEFTVRVPSENFHAFLTAVGDVAHLTRRNTGTQDVGEAYYDAELHLQTLKTKHERLLALLDKAEKMEDIITLESALSNVEYQIQQYTSTLSRYDALVGYATIQLTLQEVVRVSDTPTEADPLSTRVAAAFAEGWNGFCDTMADFAVWAAYNFVGIVIFLAFAAAAAVLLVRYLRRRRVSQARTPFTPTSIPNPTPRDEERK